MKTLMPKEFIEKVLINETGTIHEKFPYISFAIMAIGIEFIGKCINEFEDWNQSGRSKKDFELAVKNLDSLERYRDLLDRHNLWDSLRNGFSHSFVPKSTLSLSSKNEMEHLKETSETRINLKCEDFYLDFKEACNEVLNMETFNSGKMDRPLLAVPSTNPVKNDIQISGSTK